MLCYMRASLSTPAVREYMFLSLSLSLYIYIYIYIQTLQLLHTLQTNQLVYFMEIMKVHLL